jgi:phospholipase C
MRPKAIRSSSRVPPPPSTGQLAEHASAALSRVARVAGVPRVERVVAVMLENRSFDHMLGHLDHGGLSPITDETDNIKDVSDPEGPRCSVHFWPTDRDVTVDPGHGFADVVRQLTGEDPPLRHDAIDMSGFAWNYARQLVDRGENPGLACDIMGCHTAGQVPVLSTLAREFAVCSRWFCSVPSETWPNRLFAHAAQSDGLVHNHVKLYSHRSVFDVLSDAGVSWAVYAGDIPQAASYFELRDLFRDRFNTFGEFLEDVRDGTLPKYSFLEPRHFRRVDSQHPIHSVTLGDEFLRRVYDALKSNRDVWAGTLLLITYDEHGGFFDREPPVRTVPPNDKIDNEFGFGFDLLGVRVPAVVVSPYIPRGTVDDGVHDHASIVRTVLDAFSIDERLTDRDSHATSVLALLTASEPRVPPDLPPADPERITELLEAPPTVVVLDDLQASLIQLARLLDEQRGAEDIGLETGVAGLDAGDSVLDSQLEQLVERFRERHLGERPSRLS